MGGNGVSSTTITREILPEKLEAVATIKGKIHDSVATIFVSYSGLTVSQADDLRAELRPLNTQMEVCKNTFARIALSELSIDLAREVTKGPTALFYIKDDAASAAKVIVSFMKKNKAIVLKGGVLSKSPLDEATIIELAQLPSKDELIAKVVGTFKAPIDRFVLSLSSPLRGLVYVLSAIKDQKEK
jgi:large subunit ribosomal protein L10